MLFKSVIMLNVNITKEQIIDQLSIKKRAVNVCFSFFLYKDLKGWFQVCA